MNTLPNDQVDAITEYRGSQWQQAINAELGDLIKEAAALRAEINNSKTGTKKRYFEKKFKKVQAQVFQALVVKQRIDAKLGDMPPEEAKQLLADAVAEHYDPVDSVVEHYSPTANAF